MESKHLTSWLSYSQTSLIFLVHASYLNCFQIELEQSGLNEQANDAQEPKQGTQQQGFCKNQKWKLSSCRKPTSWWIPLIAWSLRPKCNSRSCTQCGNPHKLHQLIRSAQNNSALHKNWQLRKSQINIYQGFLTKNQNIAEKSANLGVEFQLNKFKGDALILLPKGNTITRMIKRNIWEKQMNEAKKNKNCYMTEEKETW